MVTYDGKADREDVETLVSRIGDAQPRLASRALWRGVAWTGALLALVGLAIALIPLVPLLHWDLHHVLGVLLGFGLFRLFDIWKPWLVGRADARADAARGRFSRWVDRWRRPR